LQPFSGDVYGWVFCAKNWQLRVTLDAIEAFDQAIAQRAQHHPDFPLFQALPGAGPVFASRLLVAFGEQRERYASAAALQK
jgi:hypothetical protein